MNRFLITILCCIGGFTAFAQHAKTIKLKRRDITYTAKHFYVTAVQDDRSDTTGIGTVRTGISGKTMKINLENGAAPAIASILAGNTHAEGATPVEVHIVQLDVSEKTAGMRQRATVTAGFAFYTEGKMLITYNGSSYVETGMDVTPYIGQLIGRSTGDALQKFDEWWQEQKEIRSQPPSVVVKATLAQPDDNDLIGFSPARPLSLSDFKGRPDKLSLGDAATYSGIATRYSSRSENGKTTVSVTVIPSFNPQRSWMKQGGNALVLQHEQQHFNITAIKACQFVQRVLQHTFSSDSYQKELDELYKKLQQEWEQMEDNYDNETGHGQQRQAQHAWEAKIRAMMEATECYR